MNKGDINYHGKNQAIYNLEVFKARKARIVPNPKLKLLSQTREFMLLKLYSLSTERSYCDWVRRYVLFHEMRSREDMNGGEAAMAKQRLALMSGITVGRATEEVEGLAQSILDSGVLSADIDRDAAHIALATVTTAVCTASPSESKGIAAVRSTRLSD